MNKGTIASTPTAFVEEAETDGVRPPRSSHDVVSPSQETHVRDLIEESNADKNVRYVDGINRERLVMRVSGLRAAIAPHKHLPAEVLATIFLLCLPEGFQLTVPYSPDCTRGDGFLPWKLSHVCSWWRQVALTEHRLWNHLVVKDGYQTKEKDFPFIVETVLSRSGQADLKLTATFPVGWLPEQRESPIPTLIKPHMHRLTVLSLRLHPQYMRVFLSSPSGTLPLLQESYLFIAVMEAHEYTAEGEVLVFKDAPRLSKFETNLGLPTVINSPNRMNLPWPQLTHLVFEGIHILPKDLYDILRQSPLLISCHLPVDQGPMEKYLFSQLPLKTIVLAYLQQMDLQVYDCANEANFLRVLTLPALSSFTYKLLSNIRQLFVPAEELPSLLERSSAPLKHLRFMDGPEYGDLGPIIRHSPSLSSLIAPLSYLSTTTMREIATGSLVPELQTLECRIDLEDAEACLDMLREHWRRCTLEMDFDDEPYTGIEGLTLHINGADESYSDGFYNDLADFLPPHASATVKAIPFPHDDDDDVDYGEW